MIDEGPSKEHGLAAKTERKRKVAIGTRKSRPKKDVDPQAVALTLAQAALDKKAINVELIDVRGKVDYADYVAVMSGRSDRQVGAIARGIQEAVQKAHGVKALGVEGVSQGAWVLIDFGDVVAHVFHDDMRGYYDLESLWIDAARLEVEGQEPASDLPYAID